MTTLASHRSYMLAMLLKEDRIEFRKERSAQGASHPGAWVRKDDGLQSG